MVAPQQALGGCRVAQLHDTQSRRSNAISHSSTHSSHLPYHQSIHQIAPFHNIAQSKFHHQLDIDRPQNILRGSPQKSFQIPIVVLRYITALEKSGCLPAAKGDCQLNYEYDVQSPVRSPLLPTGSVVAGLAADFSIASSLAGKCISDFKHVESKDSFSL